MPRNNWLPTGSRIWHHIFSQINELIVSVSIVVENVEMSTVQKVTVLRVTEIDDPTFLESSLRVKHHDTLVAVTLLHSADAVEGDVALRQTFGLSVPLLTSVNIVAEIGGESIGVFGSRLGVAGDGVVADVSARRGGQFLFDFEGAGCNKQ